MDVTDGRKELIILRSKMRSPQSDHATVEDMSDRGDIWQYIER